MCVFMSVKARYDDLCPRSWSQMFSVGLSSEYTIVLKDWEGKHTDPSSDPQHPSKRLGLAVPPLTSTGEAETGTRPVLVRELGAGLAVHTSDQYWCERLGVKYGV